jgi:hypothetical protein
MMSTTRDDWESHWHDFYEASQVNPAGAYRLRLVVRRLERTLRPGARFKISEAAWVISPLRSRAGSRKLPSVESS